jgi:hypothetical protein
MGRMMMAESATIKNQYGNPSVPGLMGVGEVMRNRMLSERFPDTVQGVMTQRKQFSPWGDGSYARTPANPMATSIAESILSGESPPTVGTSLNYGNIDTINNKPNYSSAASKAAFNSMPVEARIADARNPNPSRTASAQSVPRLTLPSTAQERLPPVLLQPQLPPAHKPSLRPPAWACWVRTTSLRWLLLPPHSPA